MRMGRELKYLQVLALAVASVVYLGIKSIPAQKDHAIASGSSYVVERVIDGDTIKLSDGSRVRLIGVDTPEVHYSDKLVADARRSGKDIKTIQSLGRRASAFTKDLCLGKAVRLEYDVEAKDRYGRRLAYVYLEDGTFLNARLIEEGYAQVMTVPPNVKHAGYFLGLEREARSGKKGLWAVR